MKIKFFDWYEHDEYIRDKYSINFPKSIEYEGNPFVLEHAIGFETISIMVDSVITESDLRKLHSFGLKMILLRSAGFNMLNTRLASELGIKVFRTANYSPQSIAEHTFALILALVRKLNVQRNKHNKNSEGRDLGDMGFVLEGKSLGLHGYGKIAQRVAKIARDGYGMKVRYCDPFVNGKFEDERVDKIFDLYSNSDIVSIHIPLNDETRASVNMRLFDKLNENFMLINTSRGDIFDYSDVVEALDKGKIKFLGTDVWSNKDEFDSRLLRDNVIQTNHIAYFTEESVSSILRQTLENLEGNPSPDNIL